MAQRQVETLLSRAASTPLHFNTRKKRVAIEAGTIVYEQRPPRKCRK
jgi:hypothetical protein